MSSVRYVTYVAGCSRSAENPLTSPLMGEVGAKRREGVEQRLQLDGIFVTKSQLRSA